jgi:predicted P-loop ATPase/GTPase
MSEEVKTIEKTHPADTNGDGKVSKEEHAMYLEFKRKELDDQDAMRDAQRKMTWFALWGLLLYPFAVVIASLAGLNEAQSTLGSMAPTYFVAVAGIVAAFFGAQAFSKGK